MLSIKWKYLKFSNRYEKFGIFFEFGRFRVKSQTASLNWSLFSILGSQILIW